MKNLKHQEWCVRQATHADYPTWAKMLASLHPDTSADEFLREIGGWVALEEPYVGFLAFDNLGKAVGMLDARLRNYAEGSPDLHGAYLEDLWVEPEVRNLGVARALLAAVENWARAEGSHWLGSDTDADNEASRAWHAAAGFAETGKLVIFGKRLAKATS